ncbi:MAG TPA: hypothetical protein VGJ55_05315 [Pyrinomonadaceae bacterium]|jgi:tetratricopeptide (TPR) repeat protein
MSFRRQKNQSLERIRQLGSELNNAARNLSELHKKTGRHFLGRGMYDEAIAVFEDAIAEYREDEEYRAERIAEARRIANEREFQEFDAQVSQDLSASSYNYGELQYNLGKAYLKAGREFEALNAFEDAMEAQQNSAFTATR